MRAPGIFVERIDVLAAEPALLLTPAPGVRAASGVSDAAAAVRASACDAHMAAQRAARPSASACVTRRSARACCSALRGGAHASVSNVDRQGADDAGWSERAACRAMAVVARETVKYSEHRFECACSMRTGCGCRPVSTDIAACDSDAKSSHTFEDLTNSKNQPPPVGPPSIRASAGA